MPTIHALIAQWESVRPITVHDHVRFMVGVPMSKQAFDKIKAGLEELIYDALPPLPDGVHYLSEESRQILHRAKMRSDELEARFVKRVP